LKEDIKHQRSDSCDALLNELKRVKGNLRLE